MNIEHRLRSKPCTFAKDSSDAKEQEQFELRTWEKAMDFFRVSERVDVRRESRTV